MPSMNRLFFVLLLAFLSLLPGCAALSPGGPVTTTVQSSPAVNSVSGIDQQQADLPLLELDGTTLFRLLTADLAVQRQQFDLAASIYLMVAKETLDPRLAEQATRLALFSQRDEDALEGARLWLSLVPESRAGREAIISAYIRSGEGLAVQEHLEYLLENAGDDLEPVFSLIVSLLQHAQDPRLAFKVMQQLVERYADNADAQFAFSYTALHARELGVARDAIEKALDIRPHWLKSMKLYAEVIRMQGHPFEAAVYLAGLVKEFPDDVSVRLSYARLLVTNRQLNEALQQYLWVVDKEPYNEDALFVTAMVSLQLNELDHSRASLQRLVDMGRRLDVAHFYLGQIAELRNEGDIAIDHYAEVSAGEHFVDSKMRMVGLLARRGDLLLARGYLDKMREQVPAQLNRFDVMEGKILEQDGQLEEAFAVYTVALERAPDDKSLLYSQALLAERMGQYELSEETFLRILALDPDNVSALNALGFSLADRSTRYQEAYDYLQRAIDLRPHSAAILDSMGWVLYRLGRLDESLEYLRRSLDIKQDQEVAAHLGEVLWMRGEHNAARAVWQQALERAPDDKLILDVMKRFEQ